MSIKQYSKHPVPRGTFWLTSRADVSDPTNTDLELLLVMDPENTTVRLELTEAQMEKLRAFV